MKKKQTWLLLVSGSLLLAMGVDTYAHSPFMRALHWISLVLALIFMLLAYRIKLFPEEKLKLRAAHPSKHERFVTMLVDVTIVIIAFHYFFPVANLSENQSFFTFLLSWGICVAILYWQIYRRKNNKPHST